MWKSLALPSGFTVDFMNMFGDGRLQEEMLKGNCSPLARRLNWG